MKQVEVPILGQGYILGCPEGGEARLGAAVAAVDREMSAIRDAGKVKARERMAVLAALNLAFEQAEAPAATDQDSASTSAADVTPDAQARLAQLLQRLDRVIEQDGQLL